MNAQNLTTEQKREIFNNLAEAQLNLCEEIHKKWIKEITEDDKWELYEVQRKLIEFQYLGKYNQTVKFTKEYVSIFEDKTEIIVSINGNSRFPISMEHIKFYEGVGKILSKFDVIVDWINAIDENIEDYYNFYCKEENN